MSYVGARVRDISGHSKALGLSQPAVGVIVAPSEGWTVKWDTPHVGSLFWSDEQLELIEPIGSQAEIQRLRTALEDVRANLVRLAWEENSVMIEGIDAALAKAESRS